MKLNLERPRSLSAHLARLRETIIAEARAALGVPERLLRLAVNEAEALAWQTPFPHLFLPELAAEKVRAMATWQRRQQSLLPAPPRAGLRPAGPVNRLATQPNSIRALSV